MNTAIDLLKKFLSISVFVLLLIIYPSQCFSSQGNAKDYTFLYNQAIVDAGTYEPSELEELVPIVDDSITVVTWTEWNGYELGSNTLGKDIWVTISPELREKCKTFRGDLNLRLKQLLGLPPNDNKTQVVEMVVQASDMFRPCPDPDITKAECSKSFPKNVNSDHVNWFAKNVLDSYQIPGGYPWTRLGYTYDWNPDSPEVGLSEYIVREGSVVEVTSIKSTSDYCSH